MNTEHQDNGPDVRILLMYRTAIGDAVLPGEDVHTGQLRSDFSEMLLHHINGGGALELTAIGASLSEFTPARVSTTNHLAWKDKETDEWEQCERPRIFAAMEAFFIDGGLERRMEEQRVFFAALSAAGIDFGNAPRLFDLAAHAGEWRTAFVELAATGRSQGIRLSGEAVDRPKVAAAMQQAGFTREQQKLVWSNLHARQSWWRRAIPGHPGAAFGKRLLRVLNACIRPLEASAVGESSRSSKSPMYTHRNLGRKGS